jgi:predicted RNA methylase
MNSRELDQFFTTKETAEKCLKFLRPLVDLDDLSWIEPSAGSGIFLNEAKSMGFPTHVAAYDLMTQSKGVQEIDFLKTDLSIVFKKPKDKLCLGNPPFGKNSSLAVKFFNHAAKHCNMIAMIFPATFAKESLQKKLDKSFHLVAELDLGATAFNFDGELRNVPVVFQVWKKMNKERVISKPKFISEYFSFVSKEEADFAIQRVGGNAGRVKSDMSKLASASHYFIKAHRDNLKELFTQIDWTSIKNKTAGNPSIAKTELIRKLEELLN